MTPNAPKNFWFARGKDASALRNPLTNALSPIVFVCGGRPQLAEEAEQDRIRDQQNAVPAAPDTPQQGSSLLDRIYAEFLVGSAQAQEMRTEEMSVTLAPGEGAEIKLVILKVRRRTMPGPATGLS